MDRRSVILAAGALGAAAGLIEPARAQSKPTLAGPYLNLKTGKGAMILKARMMGNLDESKEKFGDGSGIVHSVRDGEAIRALMGFEIFSVGRTIKQPDGSFHFLHREIVYYTDLETGKILEEFVNPFTNEKVKVVHVVNDPWNEHFEEFEWLGPSYGGVRKLDRSLRKPFDPKWRLLPNNIIGAQVEDKFYFPATLMPDKWPRESAGPMNRVGEFFQFYCCLEDAQNSKLTSVEFHGTWTRVTPWLPWMLMGQSPGHIMYNCVFSCYDDVNCTKANVLDYTEKNFPQMRRAPTDWNVPSLSSLQNYALTQKPAPPRQ